MDFTEFRAGSNDEGRRLDRIIKHILKDNPQANVYAALRKKLIKVNGGKASADTRIVNGDIISVAAFLVPQSSPHHTQEAAFKTLFKNENLWLIDKPYGIPVQPEKGGLQDIATLIAASAPPSSSIAFRPAPLHRLDKYTTGVLAISQSLSGAMWFSKALQEHSIGKTYFGIAEGTISQEELWKDEVAGKHAETYAVPLSTGHYHGRTYTYTRFSIATGRKHQIREQTAMHGHPLLGDRSYGSDCPLPNSRAYFLHAAALAVPADNPAGIPPLIQAPLPEEFAAFISSSLH